MLINILGCQWEIHEVPKVDDDAVGLCDRDALKISLDRNLCDARRWSVLWHESLHASLDSMGMERHSSNEQLVIALATAITSLLTNNPWMATPDATSRVLKGSK
jgi:hypothetical protein